ncbi:hypothetical protein U0C82_12895 [Fulvimarina sp. 2208YS6-2-32]|uniref:Uncharacterized protein n=1 Tax=Fulvimarina uroteuthidis TaxID=3098149 RepID=A0ABU5I4L8_9HYPH|nr:hypothetical protein [Fulvimarina sp. 2208YS6-2-32]MDY8110037.1 hypothetical protein [Fulvimarina sp. 2208YS6-2-32]
MTMSDAATEVRRCAEALTKALNDAAAAGQSMTVEVVQHERDGARADRREVIVHHHDADSGIKPEDLNSANDY